MTYRFLRCLQLAVSTPRLTLAALLLGVLAPKAAFAVQGAELYRTSAHFYGRFEARVRYAAGEGVVSSFFLWKDGSSSTTTWNELDYEKVNACRLTTNIWTGKGTQSSQNNTTTFDVCADYHTYAFEWTPDYIAWFIDGTQIRRVTGASVTEYTQNASQGMAIHFNLWAGDSSFGGTLNPSTLPVRQYISWAQYSSYANGAFQLQWREDFNGATVPSGWAVGNWASPFNLSTHNPANVTFVSGIAVLSMTADNATGYTGTPPADTSGAGGTSGTGGAGGTGRGGAGGAAGNGSAGRGGAGGTAGAGGRGGTGGNASAGSGGTSSTGSGGTGGGTAGSGTGGVATGAAGNGAGGTQAGTAGNGAGGVSAGSAGTTGPSGSAGSSGTGGTSATGSGGVAATGGASGAGGTTAGAAGSPPGSDTGCACRAAAGDGLAGSGGPIAVLLIVACALRRRPSRQRRFAQRGGHARAVE